MLIAIVNRTRFTQVLVPIAANAQSAKKLHIGTQFYRQPEERYLQPIQNTGSINTVLKFSKLATLPDWMGNQTKTFIPIGIGKIAPESTPDNCISFPVNETRT
jgi:hypothetical protein